MIGDKISDVDLALGAGRGACLVRTGYGSQQERRLGERSPVLVADDLLAAVVATWGNHQLGAGRPARCGASS